MATPLTQLYRGDAPAAEQGQALFINRDLSLIEFYRRVLGESLEPRVPLLERLKFLAIFSSLIDEFYMIRIGSLREKAAGIMQLSPDGLTPEQQLTEIRRRIHEMTDVHMDCLNNQVLPELNKNGIVLLRYNSLSTSEQGDFTEYFADQIYPVLTPQAVDPSHPFPYISSGTLNIGLFITPELDKRVRDALAMHGEEIFVRMKIPSFLPRLLPVAGRQVPLS
jgi:polyphosphate kinase